MNSEQGKEPRKKAERETDGKYRSRTHSKAEKRKQRKAWVEKEKTERRSERIKKQHSLQMSRGLQIEVMP